MPIVVLIPKPGKSNALSVNYKSIALTSCLCKLFERMLKERLMECLDMNNIFTNIQCGARKTSEIDHLVSVENEVRNAFAHSEYMLSVFFDLEKAYDMTGKHGILRDFYAAGLRDHLPNYIKETLKDRTFQVNVDNRLSGTKQQLNGVLQGSILSVTLHTKN